jgi:hypothetical protein
MMKKTLKKLLARLKSFLDKILPGDIGKTYKHIPWDKCTKSSCWDGPKASIRLMNILSPHIGESKFKEYVKWMKDRGCNTAQLILLNLGDGMGAPYSIYGDKILSFGRPDKSIAKMFLNRIKYIRDQGMAVILWLMTDDSTAWNKQVAANANAYIKDLHDTGLLDEDLISIVVLGLEMSEYFSNAKDVYAIFSALKEKWPGMIGTHDVPYKYTFHTYGDLVFYQVDPGTTAKSALSLLQTVKDRTGKPVHMFEMERNATDNNCHAKMVEILDSGIPFGVGNW